MNEVQEGSVKDWTGNTKSTFSTLGATAHSVYDRQSHDYYATHPSAAEMLLSIESFHKNIWEPACGEGHLSKVFENAGHIVTSTDLIDRGYGGVADFLKCTDKFDGDIITNPPFRYAQEFIEKALSLVDDGRKVAMFLRLQFLEGKKRKRLFESYPPKYVYVSSSRIPCAINGNFDDIKNGSAVCFAWFIWHKGFDGETIIRWFN